MNCLSRVWGWRKFRAQRQRIPNASVRPFTPLRLNRPPQSHPPVLQISADARKRAYNHSTFQPSGIPSTTQTPKSTPLAFAGRGRASVSCAGPPSSDNAHSLSNTADSDASVGVHRNALPGRSEGLRAANPRCSLHTTLRTKRSWHPNS